jgi:hypothetical protein
MTKCSAILCWLGAQKVLGESRFDDEADKLISTPQL